MRLPGRRRRAEDPISDVPLRQGPIEVPAGISRAASQHRREQVLAAARDDDTGHWVLVTTWRLVVVEPEGRVRSARAWHEVDTGAWDLETGVLSITWVDGTRAGQWRLRQRTGPGLVPVALRERVQSSVVLTRHLDLGPRRNARVVIRTDHESRELLEQVVRGRGVAADDPELEAEILAARAQLRDQVGLPAPGLTGPG